MVQLGLKTTPPRTNTESDRSFVHIQHNIQNTYNCDVALARPARDKTKVDINRVQRALELLQRRGKRRKTGSYTSFRSMVLQPEWSGWQKAYDRVEGRTTPETKQQPAISVTKAPINGRPRPKTAGVIRRPLGVEAQHDIRSSMKINDIDCDQKEINSNDLSNFFDRLGVSMNLNEAQHLVNLVDEKGKGSICAKEFDRLMYSPSSKLPYCEKTAEDNRMKDVLKRVRPKQTLMSSAFLKVDPAREYRINKEAFDAAMGHLMPADHDVAEELWDMATEKGKHQLVDWRDICYDVVNYSKTRQPDTPTYVQSPKHEKRHKEDQQVLMSQRWTNVNRALERQRPASAGPRIMSRGHAVTSNFHSPSAAMPKAHPLFVARSQQARTPIGRRSVENTRRLWPECVINWEK